MIHFDAGRVPTGISYSEFRVEYLSLPNVYAAGDITGAPKQIVVAVSHGSIAAMSAFEDLSGPGWMRLKENKK